MVNIQKTIRCKSFFELVVCCVAAVQACHIVTAWVRCWRSGQLGQTIKTGQSQRTENQQTEPDMVHLCVSISDNGLRLESVKKRSQKSVRSRGAELTNMATLRRQPRSRAASTRQNRGSCSSTASCPVFSGPYSDHEEDPPLRRQSSPLLKGSLSSLHTATYPSPKGSFSGLQGSVPCLQGSLSSLQGSLSSFQSSLPNLRGSMSSLKRHSLGSLESPSPNEWSTSLQSCNGSSSDDDGSWDTNSWSSGATCLLRTPAKQDKSDSTRDLCEKSCNTDQVSSAAEPENEIIYQNLIFSNPADEAESKGDCTSRICTVVRKDKGTQSMSSSFLNKSVSQNVSSHQRDEKTDDRRMFSQFLNEVTCRVLKSNGGPPQQQSSPHHQYSSPPPAPPSTPCHPPHNSIPANPPPSSASAANLWYSPTASNLQTIKECDSKDITSSIHQWSKTLPSCKILEPEEMLRKAQGESSSYLEHNIDLYTKIQAQPSTGRLYLETDIDRVRRLDELVANGTLGKERNDNAQEKGMERGKEKGNRIPWERNGDLGMEKGKERDKRKEGPWERNRGGGKGRENDTEREKPCWEQDRRTDRGREKEKKMVPTNYEPPASTSGRSNPCPVFSWPEGFPRMSIRATSLPRPANITVSTPLYSCAFFVGSSTQK